MDSSIITINVLSERVYRMLEFSFQTSDYIMIFIVSIVSFVVVTLTQAWIFSLVFRLDLFSYTHKLMLDRLTKIEKKLSSKSEVEKSRQHSNTP